MQNCQCGRGCRTGIDRGVGVIEGRDGQYLLVCIQYPTAAAVHVPMATIAPLTGFSRNPSSRAAIALPVEGVGHVPVSGLPTRGAHLWADQCTYICAESGAQPRASLLVNDSVHQAGGKGHCGQVTQGQGRIGDEVVWAGNVVNRCSAMCTRPIVSCHCPRFACARTQGTYTTCQSTEPNLA